MSAKKIKFKIRNTQLHAHAYFPRLQLGYIGGKIGIYSRDRILMHGPVAWLRRIFFEEIEWRALVD